MLALHLQQSVGTNYAVDPQDIIGTKDALRQLGYYAVLPHRGIDDWTDDAMFDGIRNFQKDKDLKIYGFMRPGGPTEQAINMQLSSYRDDPSNKKQKPGQYTQPPGTSTRCPTPSGGTRDKDNPWWATDENGVTVRCVNKGIFGPYGGYGWEIVPAYPSSR